MLPFLQCSKPCSQGFQRRTVKCREVSSFIQVKGRCLKKRPHHKRTCYIKKCGDVFPTISNIGKSIKEQLNDFSYRLYSRIPRAPRRKQKQMKNSLSMLIGALKEKTGIWLQNDKIYTIGYNFQLLIYPTLSNLTFYSLVHLRLEVSKVKCDKQRRIWDVFDAKQL